MHNLSICHKANQVEMTKWIQFVGATIVELFKNSLGPLGRQFPPPSKLSQIVCQPKLFLNKLFYGLWRVALKG